MHGGQLFAEIVIVAGLTVAGSWLIFMIATAQTIRREDERAHGDVPHLPDDATTRGTGGGGPSISAGRRKREHGTSLTHSEDAS